MFRAALKSGYVMMSSSMQRNVMISAHRCLPICCVDTNLNKAELPADFHKKLSRVVADTLGKEEKAITVTIRSDLAMCRDGRTDPVVSVSIWSIGVFDTDRNPTYVKQLYDFIVPELKIPADRVVLALHPLAKEAAGHLTYAELFSDK